MLRTEFSNLIKDRDFTAIFWSQKMPEKTLYLIGRKLSFSLKIQGVQNRVLVAALRQNPQEILRSRHIYLPENATFHSILQL